MSWFQFGRKNEVNANSDNGILGLKHLENLTEIIQNPHKLEKFEWRRKLKSTTGNSRFRIKYYGELHKTYKSLIGSTDISPQKIIAIDTQTNEEILIFDGYKHGYNAMMCDEYSKEQIVDREIEKKYTDETGNDTFEIILSAYYQIDYEDEFRDQVDENGIIEIANGDKIKFEELKRNGCDCFQIWGINESGSKIEILSEELS